MTNSNTISKWPSQRPGHSEHSRAAHDAPSPDLVVSEARARDASHHVASIRRARTTPTRPSRSTERFEDRHWRYVALSKCRPLGPHGIDLVPEAKKDQDNHVMKSFTHSIGSLFQPIFHLFGWILAFFYGLIPNYGVAIILLTIVIMGALTPFTIKSTKSMQAMQRLQPEIKKLQQKYKGPENRQTPQRGDDEALQGRGRQPARWMPPGSAPGAVPLHSLQRHQGSRQRGPSRENSWWQQPRYIPQSSKMYHDLIASHGQINVFGMDLNLKAFSAHSSFAAQIPFFAFVAVAVGLQYFQMAQLNNRSRKAGQAMPAQQLMMQRFLPIFFAYFYLVIPAAVVLYMIVSTGIRIITQDLMFRAGISNPQKNGVKPVEKELPARGAEQGKEGRAETFNYQAPGTESLEGKAQKKGTLTMDWVETTGKSIDEATDRALAHLGVHRDDAEVEILEEPKAGLFGRIRGEARVRARVRPAGPRPKRSRRSGGREDRPRSTEGRDDNKTTRRRRRSRTRASVPRRIVSGPSQVAHDASIERDHTEVREGFIKGEQHG